MDNLFLFQYLNGFGLGTWVTRNVDAGRWAAAFFLVLTNSATTAQAASATAAISVASHAIASTQVTAASAFPFLPWKGDFGYADRLVIDFEAGEFTFAHFDL